MTSDLHVERGKAASRPAGLAPLRFIGRHPALAVFLVATALALVVTQPVLIHFSDIIYGIPGDATGAVTQYWWWGYAITHGRSIFDNTLEGVPLGSEWSNTPFVVLPLLIFPFLSAVIGPVASYNLLIISGFPLTAVATYMLARRLGVTALAAAFSGLAFAFAPYHIEKAMGHGNQTHMEFIALALYFLLGWREDGRRRNAAVAGAMLGLQLWADYSLAFVLVFGLLAFFVVNVFFPKRGLAAARWLASNIAAGLTMSATAILFVPLMLLAAHRPGAPGSLSSSVGVQLGTLHRDIGELQIYSARPWEFLQPWLANPLVPNAIKTWELNHMHGSNAVESTLFVGYTVMALALVGLALGRRWYATALCIGLAAVGIVMSTPPTFHIVGIELHGPSNYIYDVINFFRVYARFAVLTLLGAALLAGVGLSVLEVRLGGGRRQALLLIPFILIAVEFNNMPPAHVTQLLPAPPEYTWLRDQPPGVLMEYPAHSGDDLTQEIEVRQYMLYQMVHLHATFLNESPTMGVVASAAAQLEPYYAPGVVARLKSYGVRYVFVHRSDYIRAGWMLPQDVSGLTYVTTLGGTDIYTVN